MIDAFSHTDEMARLHEEALTENIATFRTMLDRVHSDDERARLWANIRKSEMALTNVRTMIKDIERLRAKMRAAGA